MICFLNKTLQEQTAMVRQKNAVIVDISISKAEYAEHVANEINEQIQ